MGRKRNIIPGIFFNLFGVDGRQTRSMLEPYVMDGDTVAWIANYDEGWELLSNDRRSPLVLARSESGRFSFFFVTNYSLLN